MFDADNVVLQDLFLEQVPKTPEGIAVVDGANGARLTYRELDDVTNLLAVELVEKYNVRPDSVVGILLPRCIQYVIGYVATLKAGGAYMSLELVYPKQLLERAISETKANVILTTAAYANRLPPDQDVIIFDDQAPYFTPSFDVNLYTYPSPNYVRPNPDHLAFVVMSSGTTGVPKGICQTHRAAIHSYVDRFDRYPYYQKEVTIDDAVHKLVDDRVGVGIFFVWELFRPLCRGATCVVIPDHVLFDAEALTDFIQRYDVTRLMVTPSLMQLLVDSVDPAILSQKMKGLRYLWYCGEVVSTELALEGLKLLPNTRSLNLYSISECHDVSIGDFNNDLDQSRKFATCGINIPGVKFYVVDLEEDATAPMKLVPPGETGEVYVGGPVVGRGYLNMPEKTNEKFVQNTFDPQDITCPRLYKTGDLGRILPNGHLEILGRCDFMVKIRGYSVVLGAVESALGKHPKLSSSAVIAVGAEGSRDKYLVAYVVPVNWHDPPSVKSVRTFLKDHLPPYAIPSTFIVIDSLPVAATFSGKLDRKGLPDPQSGQRLRAFSDEFDISTKPLQTQQRLAPQNHTEQSVLNIWADVLNLSRDELSALDNFFEVGGHSMLATKMVGLVNKALGLTTETGLNIMTVMEDPTIRGIAEHINSTGVARYSKVDLQAEAESLDPSIYPFATRKSNTLARFRMETDVLTRPRVVFLTGATGYLGVHILAELLLSGVTVVALARAKTDELAKERLVSTLEKHNLLTALHDSDDNVIESHLVGVAGDLCKPLLGMHGLQFKSLALEIDSIIHCGAEVNLMKPYASLKESNVLGTQEILRLATTNGFVKTKVKPVHYIGTNGVFPVERNAYPELPICVKEDVELEKLSPHLSEGYAMSKWVAEKMCMIAEARGLPVSVMRPGNMAGSSTTGTQNPDDFNFLLIQAMIATNCAPIIDTSFALDLTPVDFAARAVVHLAVHAPERAVGQRFHLQSPQKPAPLTEVVQWLREIGHDLEAVSREEWISRLEKDKRTEKLSSAWLAFEKYFEASTWLQYGSDNLQQACGVDIQCPDLNSQLLAKWFPKE